MKKKMLQTACLLIAMLSWSCLAADFAVFVDEAFPYRIACKPEWREIEKTDSTLRLENGTQGSRIRFLLKRYRIDSTFNFESREWSRMRFATNKEIADGFGRLWYSDSGETVKIGTLPGYEYFAFYKMITEEGDSVWFAEYDCWTEYDGTGYLVSLYGDTTTLVDNFDLYRGVIDSLRIKPSTTSLQPEAMSRPGRLHRQTPAAANDVLHDLLGRPQRLCTTGRVPSVLAGKGMKRCVIRQ